MAVSKKLRFEVFRRDGFACRYCGASAMKGAVLEVDHVVPKTLGGRDEPRNLVTACEPCNSGKGDTSLNAQTVEEPMLVMDEDPKAELGSFDPEIRLATWVEDLEMSAAIAWCRNWTPGPTGFGEFGVSVALAIASGCKTQTIIQASEAAGEAQDPDLFSYLEQLPQPTEDPGLAQAYQEALHRLAAFVPGERRQLIWHARRAAIGQPYPRDLIRSAAEISYKLVEHGRDSDVLRLYLNNLPGSAGSKLLIKATQNWDAVWDGQRGHSAHECPDEVLELAISLALGATVRV